MQRVGVHDTTQTQSLEFSPNGRIKKWNKKCLVMIDKNNGCITKSKLTITVKTLSKYNDPSRVTARQTNKQTNKQT